MNPHPAPLPQLIASFDEIQRHLETLRASKNKLLDDYIQQGITPAQAIIDYQSVLRSLQQTADQTSQDIRSLISQ